MTTTKLSTLTYHSFLDITVCTAETCNHAVPVSAVSRHLRQVHKETADYAMQVQEELESKRTPLPEPMPQDRQWYFDAAAGTHRIPLPPLPFLPVYQCLLCPLCKCIKRSPDVMRRHIKQCEIDGSPPPYEPMPIAVNAQALYGGNRAIFFQVYNAQIDAVLKMMVADEGQAPGTLSNACVQQYDSFLSEMRFDTLLESYNLNLEQAFEATRWQIVAPHPQVRHLLAVYIHNAFSTAERKSYIKSHTVLDGSLRLNVSTQTLSSYIGRLGKFISFLLYVESWPQSVRGGRIMTELQANLVRQLRKVCEAKEADMISSINLVHDLLTSTLLDPLDTENDVVPLYIACSSVRGDVRNGYRFSTAAECSPILAALKYLIKCVVVSFIYGCKRNADERNSAWEFIEKATAKHADTGATYVSHCLRCCHRLAQAEAHNINMVICTQHPMCGIVDGQEVSLGELGCAVRKMQSETWELIQKRLLFDLALSDEFWSELHTFQDALGERTNGYWYMMHPSNHVALRKWRSVYINHVFDRIFTADGSSKKSAAESFLRHCRTVQQRLYTLLQVCSGGPARGTEALTMQIRNTATAGRTIFLSQGELLTVLTYHKSRNMQDGKGKTIVRCPDAVTAGFLQIYLMFINPLQYLLTRGSSTNISAAEPDDSFQRNQGDVDGSASCLDYLFCSYSAEKLRTAFTEHLASVNISLTTTQYRHYHAGVIKNFLPAAHRVWDETSVAGVMHLQAGHTEHTATARYGVARSQLSGITGTQLAQFRSASATWHRALSLQTGPPEPFQRLSSCSRPILQEEGNDTRNFVRSNTASVKNDKLSYAQSMREGPTTMKDIITRLSCIDETMTSILSSLKTGRERRGGSQEVQGTPRKKLKRAVSAVSFLSTFLGVQNASFQNKEQMQAVVHAMHPQTDHMVVLPTGGGKSLVFMLPSFVHADKISIVLVPLVALQDDLLQRMSSKGITAKKWGQPGLDTARIVIVSPEHLTLPRYAQFVRTEYANSRLHAIFIDECHVTLLWQDFRSCLKSVAQFVRPPNVDTPIISLTATCPPGLEHSVSMACGMREWQTIRRQTSRHNIRYSVRQVSDSLLILTAANLVGQTAAQHDSKFTRIILYIENKEKCNAVTGVLNVVCPHLETQVYHADIPMEQRQSAMKRWLEQSVNRTRVMVATSAFGCGIDTPSVRCVIHLGLPSTIMHYAQESGRAGRDGLPADSIVLHTPLLDCTKGSRSSTRDTMFGAPSLLVCDTRCRRWVLDKFMDGNNEELTCVQRGMELCDNCRSSKQARDTSDVFETVTPPPTSNSNGNSASLSAGSGADASGSPASTSVANPRSMHISAGAIASYNSHSTPEAGGAGTAKACTVSASELVPNSSFMTQENSQKDATLLPFKLRDLGSSMNGCCAPCSTTESRLVRHKSSTGDVNPGCYRNMCLRCCSSGHRASDCPILRKPKDEYGCFTCGMEKINGIVIHTAGTYGRRSCNIRNVFCFLICLWEQSSKRMLIHKAAPATQAHKTTLEFVEWLRTSKNEKGDLGIIELIPFLGDMFSL